MAADTSTSLSNAAGEWWSSTVFTSIVGGMRNWLRSRSINHADDSAVAGGHTAWARSRFSPRNSAAWVPNLAAASASADESTPTAIMDGLTSMSSSCRTR